MSACSASSCLRTVTRAARASALAGCVRGGDRCFAVNAEAILRLPSSARP
jgi:hypothetical protein